MTVDRSQFGQTAASSTAGDAITYYEHAAVRGSAESALDPVRSSLFLATMPSCLPD